MSDSPVGFHLAVFPLQAWGHARPLITLSARVAKTGSTLVTFFTTPEFVDRVKAELLRNFEVGEDAFLSRVRIVGLVHEGAVTSKTLEDAFAAAWRKLDNGEEVVCVKTGAAFPSGPKPNALIFDCFAHQSLRDAKAISGDSVKAYLWFPGLLSPFFPLFGSESLGGKGNIRVKAEEEARRTGREPVEIALEMLNARGDVVRAPGMPPMYDYEYQPQDFPMPEEIAARIFIPAYESLMIADGVFIVTSESYEPEAVATLREWYKELSKAAYIVGPLLPSGTRALAGEKQQSSQAHAIERFLDETLRTSGEHSLLYISFGSIFWPVKTPDTIWAFLDVVMELGLPFILSHASPLAGAIPDAVTAKVTAYGKGLLSPWSPQQAILNHPATGWFVSHGGQNGALEAITAGVPLIMWPFGADQPLNAVHLSENLGVAYELIEVRSGHGLKPILRNGRQAAGTTEALQAEARDVLAKAFGEDGAKKRAKLQQLRSEVLSEWEEGGASKRDFLAFLDTLKTT
ncbi:UDP-Glycosyltransferase/glycogen phosphorylase [Trametes versicolor FP-101664 SS1]|uniref:UDP-Glycosyltransferase/glycogen phosphorylase n=1 Tax=Trametes versicolor (strain FP-101664) TaxID=717944 RepID=UPI0004621C7B|nr:UDP-Glycosyltransferase/glycogen phosphorylase [Trametes versicolor FP-101664 SS1]EIW62965.1 UDP-Glycosyltransferase/glycogen phosphorylase [Trametes versicolor FP-101664 SS1]